MSSDTSGPRHAHRPATPCLRYSATALTSDRSLTAADAPLLERDQVARDRVFSKWSAETSERAEAQSFWNAFFHVFGIERRRVASFEQQVNRPRRPQAQARPHRRLLERHAADRAQERRREPGPRVRAGGGLLRRPARARPAALRAGQRFHEAAPARLRGEERRERGRDRVRLARPAQAHQALRLHRRLSGAGHQAAGPGEHPRRRADGQAARCAEGQRLRGSRARSAARAAAVLPVRRRHWHLPAGAGVSRLGRRTHRQGRLRPRPAARPTVPGAEHARRRAQPRARRTGSRPSRT